MIDRIIKERDELIDKLEQLNSDTEIIYNTLADQFPIVLSETKTSLNNAVGTFSNYQENAVSGSSANLRNIEKLKVVITAIQEEYQNIHKNDDNLLLELQNSLQFISSLTGNIDLVKSASEAMELISLNAMTYAIKAGKEGGAFSYITEELKRISSKTIEETDSLTSHGDHARKLFAEYLQYLRDLQESQKNTIDSFTEKIDFNNKNLDKGLSELLLNINNLLEVGKTIQQPLMQIMEEIQQQDIIRQSIDHVMITLQNIETRDLSKVEDALDEYTFIMNITDLSISLLADIEEKLETSIRTFKSCTEKVENILKETDRQRAKFADSLKTENQGLMTNMFTASQENLSNLFMDLSSAVRKKERIGSQSGNLYEEVDRIAEGFEDLEYLVSKYNNISIASKIEISKQEILAAMSDTVNNMDDLITSIGNDISESRRVTASFNKITKNIISSYFQTTDKEYRFIDKYKKLIDIACSNLFLEIQKIEQKITNFTLFNDTFYEIYNATSAQLWNLENVITSIKQISRKYKKIGKKAEILKENTMNTMEVHDWKIKNNRLQSIIENFTIFHHKKKAGEISGFEVEDGSVEGDITFF